MPADLSKYPHLQHLVRTNRAYRAAWKHDRLIPTMNSTDNTPPTKGIRRKVAMALRYSMAVVKWMRAGRPERTDEDVAAICDVICPNCGHFNGTSCNICGCPIRRSGPALRNKAKMATEHCPKGKW